MLLPFINIFAYNNDNINILYNHDYRAFNTVLLILDENGNLITCNDNENDPHNASNGNQYGSCFFHGLILYIH